ncbi:MAG: hypothetical protein ACT4R6_11480 [Gemmatimonadaceae bacterium]
MLNLMRRIMLPVLVGLAGAHSDAHGQHLPGRDLFDFPIAALAEGTALATFAGDGLRNPASLYVSSQERGRLSLSSLSTGREQRVSGQTLGAAYHVRGTTFGVSLARASVSDIARTDTDPQSIGGDVPYGLTVLSLAAARRAGANLTSGIALRWQRGELDSERRQDVGVDAGVVLDSVARRDIRLAASTFLWRPGAGVRSGAAFAGGVDARVLKLPRIADVRGGYTWTATLRDSDEHFAYVALRTRVWDARAGLVRLTTRTDATTRLRLALGARYGRYRLGVAREENPYGLSPAYVFILGTQLAAP